MRGDAVLLVIGLVLVCAGVFALLTGPPKVVTTASSFSVPYTSFDVLSPGPHNFTRTFSCGRNATRFSLPGTHALVLKVGNPPKINCTYSKLYLLVDGEGKLTPVKGAFINVTLSAIINGERLVLDTVKAPINVSGLAATGTPITTITTTITVTPGEAAEHELPKTSYQVGSGKGHLVIHVGKSSENEAEVAVVIDKPIYLPANTSKAMIEVSSNAPGEFGASLRANYVCVITKYLNSPQYVPRISYANVMVTDRYLDLGNLPIALVLMVAGLALMNIGCYLRAASVEASKAPQPQASPA